MQYPNWRRAGRSLPLSGALWALLLVGMPPDRAWAQDRMVTVRVVDDATGAPLVGAQIRAGRLRGVTDDRGLAVLHGFPASARRVVVTRIGYAPGSVAAPVGDIVAAELIVHLRGEAVEARGLRVEVKAPARLPALRRFYERAERGTGKFIMRDDIERSMPRRVTDLFRSVPGVRVQPTPRGDKLQMASSVPVLYGGVGTERGDCPVQYYVDGSPFTPAYPGVLGNEIRPDEVEGIEVYRRLSEVPVQFRRPGAECGVVLIWFREQL